MIWMVLLTLLGIGLILILTEIFFIPGTTIIGVMGFAISAVGVVYGFAVLESNVAWLVFSMAFILNLGAIIYGFKSGVWTKFALHDTVEGRSFDGRMDGLEIGMEGKAISDLRPIGKASFGEKILEVKSDSGYVSVGQKLIITKLDHNTIIVKS
ncbi:nodulation protein NfeD [Belliella sp. DSM 111904]|uniref:Nodulation protein NfeD n=1 Tax=Belliella filtrata TaxID=2923435 RepID=A0ABS9UXG3_9BACT|nr:NfeD family protein [Belliella filtrata]MCH7408842.1 nodulation protein NfeD [Belliella filtrata]